MNRISIAALVAPAVLLLAACGKSPDPAPAPTPPVAEAPSSNMQPPAMPVTAEPVDTCAMLSKEDAEAILGKLMQDPEAHPAQGSLLGQCNYMTQTGTLAMVSARPAAEFQATVDYTAKKAPYKEIPGLGEKAYDTSVGVMVQPAGEPYFVVVFAAGGGAASAKAVEIAKKLKL